MHAEGQAGSDLPPPSRTSIEAVKSVNQENDGQEADVARRNRAASVCLFVHSAQTAPAGLPELHRWGHDIVVVWDAEDPATDVRLKAGFLLAKALCLRANQHEEEEAASLSEMDVAIEAIRKQIARFEEIKTSARTVVGGGEKILNRARLMEEEIGRRLAALGSHSGPVAGGRRRRPGADAYARQYS